MENEEVEVIDSENDEEVETTDSEKGEEVEREEFTPREKQYFARMKKLEGQLKEVKAQPKAESDGFGYDVKAYLKSSGIQPNEFDFVKAEMKASGKDIDTLLESKYFLEGLDRHRSISKTEDATIKGKRSGGVSTDSVEYWAAKDFADVPVEMRGKVLAHRESKEKNKGTFYNT